MGKGHIEPFSTEGTAAEVAQRWKKWHRAFDYYVRAEAISDANRQACLLLHLAGPSVQGIFEDLPDPLATAPVDDDEFKKTVRKLNDHFSFEANPTYMSGIYFDTSHHMRTRTARNLPRD